MMHLLHNFGIIGLVLTIFGEIGCMLFFLPGDTLIFGSGLLIHKGLFDFWTIILAIFLTSTIAGEFSYFWATKVSREKLMNNKLYKIKDKDMEYTEKFFIKYGAWAIIFSRFFPVVRNLISPICGILRYDKRKFFIFNIIASALWPLVVVSFGFYFGKYFPNLIRYVEVIMLIGILAVAAPFIFDFIKKNFKRKI